MSPSQSNEVLLVCDLNVFVQAYLFNCRTLLEGPDYSFGKLLIHQTVLDEIQSWSKSSLKIRKFTLPIIQSMISKCASLAVSTPNLSDDEKNKYFRRISRTEDTLGASEKSQATSSSDKMYLALAIKSNGNIATHETSLRSITKKSIGEGRLFSVGRMIEDRKKQGLLTKQDIQDGILNLSHYNECLMNEDNRVVNAILNAA
jgi:tellurite resistance protein